MVRFSIFIVKRRWWILAFWLVAAILIVSLSPKLSSVESNDQSSFLPKSYESIKALNVANQISKHSQDATDLIVFKNKNGQSLSQSDIHVVNEIGAALANKHLPHIASVSPNAQLSPNQKV